MRLTLIAPMALAASLIATAAAAAPAGAAKSAKVRPIPKIDISAIGAPRIQRHAPGDPRGIARLTEPDIAGLVAPPRFSVGREGDARSGKRVKVAVPVGDNSIYLLGGRIEGRPRAGAFEGSGRSHKLEGGKMLGGGVERKFGPVEVGADYQFSTINSQELDPSASGRAFGVAMDDDATSHSLRATARLRF